MGNKKDKWSQLSMQQRADFSDIAIRNGIRDRKSIIQLYNDTHEDNSYKNGRILSGNKNFNYVEQLPQQEEIAPQTNNTPTYLFNPKGYSASEVFTDLPTRMEANQKSREYLNGLGKDVSSLTPEEKNKFIELRLADTPKAQYKALMTDAEKEAKNRLIERDKLENTGIPAINVGFEDASNSPALNDAIDYMSKWYSHPTTKAIVQKDAKFPNLIYGTKVPYEDGLSKFVDVPTRDPYMAKVDYGTTVNAGYSDFGEYKAPNGANVRTGGVAAPGNQVRADKSVKGTQQEKFIWMHEINHILQNAFGLYKDRDKEYADRKHEIHSYLMELRRHFGLNPGKRDYTPEDANQMINEMKKYEYIDEDGNRSYPGAPTSVQFFLNRMNDGYGVSASQLSHFLNTLADASNGNNPGIQDVMTGNELISTPEYNNGVYSAANGGRLYSGEEIVQPIDENIVYYDNTSIEPSVVKAFPNQESYNRYQGQKFGKEILRERDRLANKNVNIIYRIAKLNPLVSFASNFIEPAESLNSGDFLENATGIVGDISDKKPGLSRSPFGKVFKTLDYFNLAKDVNNILQTPLSEFSNGGRILSGKKR